MPRRATRKVQGETRTRLVRAGLIVLCIGLLGWGVYLQLQVVRLNAQVAELKQPIVITGYPDRQFTSVNDLALALLRVHEREKGLERAIEDDLHSGNSAMLRTHEFIDGKRWAADATTEKEGPPR